MTSKENSIDSAQMHGFYRSVLRPRRDISESLLLGTGDDLLLQIPAYVHEIVAVAADPDDQVAMLLGILLRFS